MGLGLGWGFGNGFGCQYRSSKVRFQGVEFVQKGVIDKAAVPESSKHVQEVQASK